MTKPRKLPDDVYYSRRRGGMYIMWDGRPEGSVYYTHDKDVAYGIAEEIDEPEAGQTRDGWFMTPFQGADGSCHLRRIITIAADYGGRL